MNPIAGPSTFARSPVARRARPMGNVGWQFVFLMGVLTSVPPVPGRAEAPAFHRSWAERFFAAPSASAWVIPGTPYGTLGTKER
jgi:hypothetical protein